MYLYPTLEDFIPAARGLASTLRSLNLSGGNVQKGNKEVFICYGFISDQVFGDPDAGGDDPTPAPATAEAGEARELTHAECADLLEAIANHHEGGEGLMAAGSFDWKSLLKTLGPIVLQILSSL